MQEDNLTKETAPTLPKQEDNVIEEAALAGPHQARQQNSHKTI